MVEAIKSFNLLLPLRLDVAYGNLYIYHWISVVKKSHLVFIKDANLTLVFPN